MIRVHIFLLSDICVSHFWKAPVSTDNKHNTMLNPLYKPIYQQNI